MTPLPARVLAAPNVLFQTLGGEAVLLNLKTEGYYGLNGIAMHMYQELVAQGKPELALTKLLDEYDVAETTLREDLATLIGKLADRGLVTVD